MKIYAEFFGNNIEVNSRTSSLLLRTSSWQREGERRSIMPLDSITCGRCGAHFDVSVPRGQRIRRYDLIRSILGEWWWHSKVKCPKRFCRRWIGVAFEDDSPALKSGHMEDEDSDRPHTPHLLTRDNDEKRLGEGGYGLNQVEKFLEQADYVERSLMAYKDGKTSEQFLFLREINRRKE